MAPRSLRIGFVRPRLRARPFAARLLCTILGHLLIVRPSFLYVVTLLALPPLVEMLFVYFGPLLLVWEGLGQMWSIERVMQVPSTRPTPRTTSRRPSAQPTPTTSPTTGGTASGDLYPFAEKSKPLLMPMAILFTPVTVKLGAAGLRDRWGAQRAWTLRLSTSAPSYHGPPPRRLRGGPGPPKTGPPCSPRTWSPLAPSWNGA